MNIKLCLLLLSMCFSAECAAQLAAPSDETSAFLTNLKQKEEMIRKDPTQTTLAASSDKAVSALKADLAAEWTTITVSMVYDCSCTGPSYHGFCITRTGETATVSPWRESRHGIKDTGISHPLPKPELEKLLSETVSYFLATTLSETLEEKLGPIPRDPEGEKAWMQRYLAAGGKHLAGDQISMEVRVTTSAGTKRHDDLLADAPEGFSKWLAAFGRAPE